MPMLILALSTKVLGQNDIVTFAIVHVAPKEIEADCYVYVFCEYRPSRETCSLFSRQFKHFCSKCSTRLEEDKNSWGLGSSFEESNTE